MSEAIEALAEVAVIGGCGRIGLPLSILLAGHNRVSIIDRDERRMASVRRGEIPFLEQGLSERLRDVLASRHLVVQNEPTLKSACDTVVVAIRDRKSVV